MCRNTGRYTLHDFGLGELGSAELAPIVSMGEECRDCLGTGRELSKTGTYTGSAVPCLTCHGTGSIDIADHIDNVAPVDHSYQLPGAGK